MNPPGTTAIEQPDTTWFERIGFDDLESPAVRKGARYWQRLARGRRHPSYHEIHPRDFADILPNAILVKVIDDRTDFEFRIVGGAQEQSYALPFKDRKLSEMAPTNIPYAYVLRGMFAHIAELEEPVGVRGHMGPDCPHVQYSYCESVFLPLGPECGPVDYLLGFSAFVPRA
jgi:hypothetical protein